VDRALGGKGTFTIDATWGRAGFSIHNNETSIGLFEGNAPLAKSRILPPVHPYLWCDVGVIHELHAVYEYPFTSPLQNVLVKALSAEAHIEVYARGIFFAT
jgi:hypothetical protein